MNELRPPRRELSRYEMQCRDRIRVLNARWRVWRSSMDEAWARRDAAEAKLAALTPALRALREAVEAHDAVLRINPDWMRAKFKIVEMARAVLALIPEEPKP